MLKADSKIKLNQDFLKIKSEEKATLLVIMVLMVCFVVGYFAFLPVVNNYRNNKINFKNYQQEKANLEEKQTILKDLGSRLEQKKPFIEKAKDVLPTEAQVPEVLVALEKIAVSNSLYINSFAPKSDNADSNQAVIQNQPKKEYSSVSIQFDVTGSYQDLKQFLKDIENNIRPIDIRTVSVSSGFGSSLVEGEEDLLRFSIDAMVYYQ